VVITRQRSLFTGSLRCLVGLEPPIQIQMLMYQRSATLRYSFTNCSVLSGIAHHPLRQKWCRLCVQWFYCKRSCVLPYRVYRSLELILIVVTATQGHWSTCDDDSLSSHCSRPRTRDRERLRNWLKICHSNVEHTELLLPTSFN
jgi:hypothetical protein